jgi:rhodanese-related sulfurtransferase
MKRLSPQEASALMAEGWTYVDVRTTEEFKAGHPKGAINVPFMMAGPGGMAPNPSFLADVQAKLAKDAKIICGCQAGGRSLKAATALEQAGFTQIVDQRAGFGGNNTEPGWAAAGLPIEK